MYVKVGMSWRLNYYSFVSSE